MVNALRYIAEFPYAVRYYKLKYYLLLAMAVISITRKWTGCDAGMISPVNAEKGAKEAALNRGNEPLLLPISFGLFVSNIKR